MEIDIGDEADDETARAIATAVSEHLGRSVELVDASGERVADAGEGDWDGVGAVVTDREEELRGEIETILSGGPERGHEKIAALGKLFVRDRLDMVFDTIEYEDGTFARHTDDDVLAADGLITGVGTIDGRRVAFTANDYTVKAGSLGTEGVEKVIRIEERDGARDPDAPAHRLDGGPPRRRRTRTRRHSHGALPRREDVLQPVSAIGPGPPDRRALRPRHRRLGVHTRVL